MCFKQLKHPQPTDSLKSTRSVWKEMAQCHPLLFVEGINSLGISTNKLQLRKIADNYTIGEILIVIQGQVQNLSGNSIRSGVCHLASWKFAEDDRALIKVYIPTGL